MADSVLTLGGVTRFTFGPGSLESIEVRVWTAPRSAKARKIATVRGSYRVYAPSGEYAVEIDERLSAWSAEDDYMDKLLWRAGSADPHRFDAASLLAHRVIEQALDGWTDPADESDNDE